MSACNDSTVIDTHHRTCCKERSTLILSEMLLRAEVGPHWTEVPDKKADMAVCVRENDVQ